MTRLPILALLTACPPTLAQIDGAATWLWDVTTQNGDSVVQPGETATITLSIDMEPDANYPGGPVLGFGVAQFDTIGLQNATFGHIESWQILECLDTLGGDPTTTDGVSLFGSNPGQSPLGAWTADDPLNVLQFEWSPDTIGTYEVTYETTTDTLSVVQGTGMNDFFYFEWMDVTEAEIAFEVVPSPSSVASIATCAALMCVSRRRAASMTLLRIRGTSKAA